MKLQAFTILGILLFLLPQVESLSETAVSITGGHLNRFNQNLTLSPETLKKNDILGKYTTAGISSIVNESSIAVGISAAEPLSLWLKKHGTKANESRLIGDNITKDHGNILDVWEHDVFSNSEIDFSELHSVNSLASARNIAKGSAEKADNSTDIIADACDLLPIIDNIQDLSILNLTVTDIKKLDIPTYNGVGDCVHPSVRYIQGGWAGYEWWMSFTPYPKGNPTYENPSIVASHDGIHWVLPAGLTNPIDPAPPHGHNADTELVYDGKNMYVYYIDVIRGNLTSDGPRSQAVTCHRRIVFPDMLVGAEETCANFHPISPAIIRRSNDDWIAFYCDLTSLKLSYVTSRDGLNWSDPKIVRADMQEQDIVPWHISVLQAEKGYLFLIAAYHEPKDNNGHTKLYLGYAPDLDSTLRTVPILSPEPGWTELEVYRSSMVGSRIYISASDKNHHWHIGYGTLSRRLK